MSGGERYLRTIGAQQSLTARPRPKPKPSLTEPPRHPQYQKCFMYIHGTTITINSALENCHTVHQMEEVAFPDDLP